MANSRLIIFVVGILFIGFLVGCSSRQPASIQKESITESTATIDIEGTEDTVTVCVKPGLNGKYIIRPRCDNINLKLQCNGDTPARKYSMYGAVVMDCPEKEDKKLKTTVGKKYTDVVKVKKGESLCVQCSLSDLYQLNPADISKYSDCQISGTFDTGEIKDPELLVWKRKKENKGKKDSEYKPASTLNLGDDDYCYNQETGLFDELVAVNLKVPAVKASVKFKSKKPYLEKK